LLSVTAGCRPVFPVIWSDESIIRNSSGRADDDPAGGRRDGRHDRHGREPLTDLGYRAAPGADDGHAVDFLECLATNYFVGRLHGRKV